MPIEETDRLLQVDILNTKLDYLHKLKTKRESSWFKWAYKSDLIQIGDQILECHNELIRLNDIKWRIVREATSDYKRKQTKKRTRDRHVMSTMQCHSLEG